MVTVRCPACTVGYELDVVPAAMECEHCGTLILPRDSDYMVRVRAETEALVTGIYAEGRDHPLPGTRAGRLYTRLAQILIDNAAEHGEAAPFGGRSAEAVADELVRSRERPDA